MRSWCILALALIGTLASIHGVSGARAPSRRAQATTTSSTKTVTVPTCPIWNDPCQATLQADRPASCHGEPNMYTELSAAEMVIVRDYLLSVPELALTPTSEAEPRDNYIFTLYLEPPPKKEALAFLDNNATKPARAAVARVLLGKFDPPVVKHVRVWPVSKPTNWTFVTIHQNKTSVPWLQRPWTTPESKVWWRLQNEAYGILNPFFKKEWFGWHWCEYGETDKCLTINNNAPVSTDANTRGRWMYFLRAVDGFWVNGMGSMFVRYNGTDLDPAKWSIDGIEYDGVLYGGAKEFMAAYNAGKVKVIVPEVPQSEEEALYSTFKPRPNMRNPSQPLTPLLYDPQGRRFTITNFNKIDWMGWSLFLGSHPLHGPRLHDVRFKGERIAYEVALQEAMATYGAGQKDPVQALTLYLDSHWGLGADLKELMHGVDCPSNAAYIDITTMYDGYDGIVDTPRHVRNALCVFEMPTSRAVLRHYEHDFNGNFDWWGATKESVLMIRGIFTVGNYDYMIDVVLHADGSFEMTTSTSGYPQATNYRKGTTRGFPLWKDVSGSLHEHVLFYKIDVDLISSQNSVQMHEIKPNIVKDSYIGKRVVNKQLVSSFVEKEKAIKYQFDKPMIMTVVNEQEKNSWGSLRGYSFKVDRPLYSVIGEQDLDSPYIKAIDWSKYWFAVTKQHDDEPAGSGAAYHQMVPSAPAIVSFDGMVNGESTRNDDIVVWLTSGLYHLTTAEDAPVTTITGNNLGFIMRPFNWADENGSTDLPDMTMIKRSELGTKLPATQEFLYGPANCMPPVEKILYNGNYTGWSLDA